MSHPSDAPPARLMLDDLAVWRGDRRLCHGLALAVDAGELVWLRGANGTGKTSLLRAIAGLAHLEQGRVLWRGLDTTIDPAAFRAELLFLGHLDALKRELTARENLAVDGALRAAANDPFEPVADPIGAALGALGVAATADQPVAQLSAGQRRRVALARLVMSRAPLWLLDEPTTHLDDAGQGAVARLLEAHLARGGIAFVASHLPLQLAGATPRVLELAGPSREAA